MPPLQGLLRYGHYSKPTLPPLRQQSLRDTKNPPAVEITTRSRKTSSAAGIFKRQSMISDRKKRRNQKEASLSSGFFDAFQEGLHEARSILLANSEATFDAVHGDFIDRLTEANVSDGTFLSRLSKNATILSTPLERERIETTFTRDGKHASEVIEIGKRILQFKNSVEKDEAKLRENWRLWEDLQEEYRELEIEVLNREAFNPNGQQNGASSKGYARDVGVMDLEKEIKSRETRQESGDLVAKAIGTMRATERELDAITKRERAKLLQALIDD